MLPRGQVAYVTVSFGSLGALWHGLESRDAVRLGGARQTWFVESR
jgi:hypothetical protein